MIESVWEVGDNDGRIWARRPERVDFWIGAFNFGLGLDVRYERCKK